VFLWFVGGSILAVWLVFRDPAIDYRVVALGAVLPDVVDGLLGGAAALHSVVTAIAVLVVVMLATIGRRATRRRWLGLPIGMFLHLVLDGAFADTDAFWWPLTGLSVGDAPLPSLERGLWNVALELVGLAICVWWWRRFHLADPTRRTYFLRTGRVVVGAAPAPPSC
jgi:membrane-bound metal-dependent hydrolase YbcI (DUF457 family)